MKTNRIIKLHIAAAVLLSTLNPQFSTVFAQGSLTPPGAPAPTMKTLVQIEPRTPISSVPFAIIQPGSYYLTTNLSVTTGDAITIATNGVTLDLMGFELAGGTGNGIIAVGSLTNLCIRNGTVRGWGGHGVTVNAAVNCQIADLRAASNGKAGINLFGNGGGLIQNCTLTDNATNGVVALRSTVIHCTASRNGMAGISANTCTIIGCTAEANPGTGISTSSALVKDCIAFNNGGAGIWASDTSTISGCTAAYNGGDGVEVNSDCQVLGNTCRHNGYPDPAAGAGIHALGANNRIDSNHVTGNDWGLLVDVVGNLIIRNSASDNATNYFFTGTQSFGPTNLVTGVVTNHPWANFAF